MSAWLSHVTMVVVSACFSKQFLPLLYLEFILIPKFIFTNYLYSVISCNLCTTCTRINKHINKVVPRFTVFEFTVSPDLNYENYTPIYRISRYTLYRAFFSSPKLHVKSGDICTMWDDLVPEMDPDRSENGLRKNQTFISLYLRFRSD